MVSPWSLFVHFAWLPALTVMLYKMYRGPNPLLAGFLAYFLGGVGIVPAALLNLWWNLFMPSGGLVGLIEMPLWFAPVEEGCKIFATLIAARLLGLVPPRRDFLPLAMASALGFASVETGIAVTEFGLGILPARVVLSIPAHVVFTSFAAAGLVGQPHKPVNKWAFMGWWTLASLAHTCYNFVLLNDPDATLLDVFLWMGAIAAASALLAYVRKRKAPPHSS